MSRIFVTGSTTGLGLLTGKDLVELGHEVVFHARSPARVEELKRAHPGAKSIVVGDLGTISGALDVAEQANAIGPMSAVVHNAGVGYGSGRKQAADGLPEIFMVNVLAPYILTAIMHRPQRLIYLSSGMHRAEPHLEDALWQSRPWSGSTAYSESKLYLTMLSFAVARLWPGTNSNAVDPGWVPTRMGGRGAPDDLAEGFATQVVLAAATDPHFAGLTGQYLYHMAVRQPDRKTRDAILQDQLLDYCRSLSGKAL